MKSTDPRNCWIKSAMPSASNTVPSTDLESLSRLLSTRESERGCLLAWGYDRSGWLRRSHLQHPRQTVSLRASL
jgi:hypothetical protein